MSDEVIIASTTDTAEQIQAAMGHAIEEPSADDVLAVVEDDAPAEEEKPAGEKKADEKPAVKVETEKPQVKAVEKKEPDEDSLGARAQKRISKLVAEREDAKRRGDDLEARVKELEAAGKKPDEKPAVVVPAAGAAETDPAWLTAHPEPQQDDFPDYEAYAKKWTTWEYDRREVIAVRKAEEAGRAAAQKVLDDRDKKTAEDAAAADRTELFQRFEATKDEARTRYADFDEVIEGAKDLTLSGPMQFVIMDSAVGHDMAYWLAQPEHREEADRLASLDGAEAIRELGRLERSIELQVDTAAAGEKPAPKVVPPKKVAAAPKAPAPIVPVGGRGVATTLDLNDPNMKQEDWKAERNRQEFARRRRR